MKTTTIRVFALPLFALGSMLLAAGRDYLLGPGDSVKVSVYEQPDLTTETRISEAGTISFPLLGQVVIGGGTTAAAENAIAKELKDQKLVKQPHVSVAVTQYRSQQISVLGQVNKPGKYSIEATSTLADLLALAGGVAPTGADTATLIRQGPGGAAKKEIDLLALLQAGDFSKNLEVRNGDVIYVPRAPQFYIYGEVQRPGAYRLERNMTVMQGLSVGGGLTPRGTERGITVKRRGGNGEPKAVDLKLTDMLAPDDVVVVKESLF
jgi:polysaccharide biosynthesis/export protein